MSQDIVSDGLNQIMNARRAKKEKIILERYSKLLVNILEMAKESDYLDYELQGNKIIVSLKNLNEIRAIKPRYTVNVKRINKYVRRFLPAKDFGFVVVSTNKGLMKHSEAEEKEIGGCLIAYIF